MGDYRGNIMEEQTFTPSELLQIIRRRRLPLLLPSILILIIGIAVALLLPAYYRSVATILIEEQEIPQDYVVATVTSYAEQRLQTINQRIMSTTRLLEVINRFNLYPELREKWVDEEIVEKMREDIKLETISADVIDRRSGKTTTATIAFTLSYEGKNPEKVQQVANLLTSYFLEENLKVRQRQTREASQFLSDEMQRVKKDLDVLEEKIAAFKELHINELPELLQTNLKSLGLIEMKIDQLNEHLRNLKERKEYLEIQRSALSPERESDLDQKRLEELTVQLISLETRFSDAYPDVVKIKAEIVALKQKLAEKGSATSQAFKTEPKNPLYITASAQLAGIESEIESTKRQIQETDHRRLQYEKRIESTPKIEKMYNELLIKRNTTMAKYNDLMRKYMEANVAKGLEQEQKGERFTLIDPPLLPEKPFKPNRIVIVLVSLLLGFGTGAGLAVLMEFSDDAVRDSVALSGAMNLPVLAGIPLIETNVDLKRKRRKRLIIFIAACLFIFIAILAFHFFVMDLYVFWAKLMRKLAV